MVRCKELKWWQEVLPLAKPKELEQWLVAERPALAAAEQPRPGAVAMLAVPEHQKLMALLAETSPRIGRRHQHRRPQAAAAS